MLDSSQVVGVKLIQFFNDTLDSHNIGDCSNSLVGDISDEMLLEVLTISLAFTFQLRSSLLDSVEQLFNFFALKGHSFVKLTFGVLITIWEGASRSTRRGGSLLLSHFCLFDCTTNFFKFKL